MAFKPKRRAMSKPRKPNSFRNKVILDMDPGVDDALAIGLAVKSGRFDILGITAVCGNSTVHNTSRNALRVLHLLGRDDIAVYRGAQRPLKNKLDTTYSSQWHGKDGLGDLNIPFSPRKLEKKSAHQFILDTLEQNPAGTVDIIATGPLTNLAHAIETDESVFRKVARIVMMSGAFGLTQYGKGNATPYAEFNVYTDPEAASIVYSSGVPICALGNDVAGNPVTGFSKTEYQALKGIGTPLADLAYRATGSWHSAEGYVALFDPLAVALAGWPELFTTEKRNVHVELSGERRGQTATTQDKNSSEIDIATSVDAPKFKKLMMKALMP